MDVAAVSAILMLSMRSILIEPIRSGQPVMDRLVSDDTPSSVSAASDGCASKASAVSVAGSFRSVSVDVSGTRT